MLQLKIGQHIDKYGFLGREYHPHESDMGLTCRVLGVQTLYLRLGEEADEKPALTLHDGEPIELDLLASYTPDDFETLKTSSVDVYYVVTEDLRVLEIMEHEVESITLVRE